jgi:hypothetical protein
VRAGQSILRANGDLAAAPADGERGGAESGRLDGVGRRLNRPGRLDRGESDGRRRAAWFKPPRDPRRAGLRRLVPRNQAGSRRGDGRMRKQASPRGLRLSRRARPRAATALRVPTSAAGSIGSAVLRPRRGTDASRPVVALGAALRAEARSTGPGLTWAAVRARARSTGPGLTWAAVRMSARSTGRGLKVLAVPKSEG